MTCVTRAHAIRFRHYAASSAKKPELFTKFAYGICGDKMTVDEFWAQGHETARLEYQYNVKSGIAPAQDKLPEYMCRIPLPPNNHVFDLSDEEMQKGRLC